MFRHNNPYRLPGIISSIFLTVLSLTTNFWHPAQAAPEEVYAVIVDITNDDPSKSACTIVDNDCSLRGAISYANATAAGSEIHITIPAGTYSLSLTGPGDDTNASGDLDIISRTVYLTGAGSSGLSATILDGASSDRVLDNHGGTLFVEHLQITHGSVATGGGGGGGIKNRYGSTLNMDDVVVEANAVAGTASQDSGGGIVTEGPVSILNSTISENTAYSGGGLFNAYASVQFHLSYVLIAGNTAAYGGGLSFYGGTDGDISDSTFYNNTGGQGGGIYNYGDLTLNRVTLSDNHSPATGNFGGGIQNWASLTLMNVTIAGNDAYSAGGFHAVNGSNATFNHCTIANNISSHYGQDVYISFGSTNSFHNTIVSRSQVGDTTCFLDDPRDVITDLGYNLSSDHSCGFSTSAPYYDLIDVSPTLVLLSLGYYGGPTETIALVAHGPAVDSADPVTSLTRDQRGYFRPMGGRSDIGAFEWNSVLLDLFSWLPLILK
jgi:hypothetical protein